MRIEKNRTADDMFREIYIPHNFHVQRPVSLKLKNVKKQKWQRNTKIEEESNEGREKYFRGSLKKHK